MKMTTEQQKEFWMMAQAWAGSTLDTPKRAALLIEHVEGLIESGGRSGKPPEGILHHALRDLTEREQAGAARAAADALANIDAHHARMAQRRAESEQRTGEDRRKPRTGPVGVVEQGNRQGELRSSTGRRQPRSDDMVQVTSVLLPQRREFVG